MYIPIYKILFLFFLKPVGFGILSLLYKIPDYYSDTKFQFDSEI